MENLVTYSSEAHKIAASFLYKIMDETDIHLPEILFSSKWEEVMDKSSQFTKYQAKHSLDELANSQSNKCPIISLVKNIVRISHNVSEESLKNNSRMLKMLSNTFLTFKLLMSLRHKDKTYHAFTVLSKNSENSSSEFSEENCVFEKYFDNILTVGKTIVEINTKLFGNFTRIIVEPQNNTNIPQQPPPKTNLPKELPRVKDNAQTIPPTNPSTQAFNINSNTFIDDEEYGLNVEDFDMEIKVWSELISSILKFMKSVLINDTVFNISKSMQKKKLDRCPIIMKRNEIIFSMFELIGRVERSVR